MEQIKLLERKAGSILLMNAIAGNEELIKKVIIDSPKAGDDTTANVQLFINGVEVSFLGAMENAYGQWQDAVEEEARKMLTTSVMKKLHARIASLENYLYTMESLEDNWEFDEIIQNAYNEMKGTK